MFFLILQLIFFVVGIIGIIIGIKDQDPMMLGYGIFLLVGMSFFELMDMKDKIKEMNVRFQNSKS